MYKAFEKWLLPYFAQRLRSRSEPPRHLVIAVCDHFEPFHATDRRGALARIAHWREAFRKITDEFSDADGHPPKHSFFYPIEQYDEEVVSGISRICRETGSEAGIHLHHDNDDAASLEQTLVEGRTRLQDHGLIGPGGRYPFIHGNWALANSHPEGRYCGVDDELGVLRRTGCYADFTLPSAPSPTQTPTINSIYYATCTGRPRSHGTGIDAGPETSSLRHEANRLLIIQGPLGLNWRNRKFGVLPRIENADLTGANPPSPGRLALWAILAPRLLSRPEVAFIKLHTHGAIERNSGALLGEPIKAFHRHLKTLDAACHYATAREMTNIIHAFEDGHGGGPGEYRDYIFPKPSPR